MNSPAGDAIRAIKCEAVSDPELAQLIDARFQAPRREALLGILRRGVARGEVRPDAVTPVVADVIPAMITHRIILQREPLAEQDIDRDDRAGLPAAGRGAAARPDRDALRADRAPIVPMRHHGAAVGMPSAHAAWRHTARAEPARRRRAHVAGLGPARTTPPADGPGRWARVRAPISSARPT